MSDCSADPGEHAAAGDLVPVGEPLRGEQARAHACEILMTATNTNTAEEARQRALGKVDAATAGQPVRNGDSAPTSRDRRV